MSQKSREQAKAIWQSGVDAVKPSRLFDEFFASQSTLFNELKAADRILVVGGGKAGAAMAEALEAHLSKFLNRVEGIVNVPNESVRPLQKIRLHGARPMGSNHPTEAGVIGSREMLLLADQAGPNDVMICLISGGGSALMPAPTAGITLEDKQKVTKLLHSCGASIEELNGVRSPLSDIKAGNLARRFRGKLLISLIVSDVIGDPLDVIASGPTYLPDATTAKNSPLEILARKGLLEQVPPRVIEVLKSKSGRLEQQAPQAEIRNVILGNNQKALAAAAITAQGMGFHTLNLGSFLEGDTQGLARVHLSLARSIQINGLPLPSPACLISGGETTVDLRGTSGKGGRNQEFVLAALTFAKSLRGLTVLSGGTDGEDGPTDAAGALADEETAAIHAEEYLRQHNSYEFFEKAGGLLKTGLTETNVMDLRVLLIDQK
ncbi:DUF4147 domain-containing protein [Telmatocola sphagniphila]|uniref:DUF4147 domain-containing protein n=1 Tax=Telmatocola sphagniphila TaxID=1123043 RepID=A0A8E6B9D5_9BACT|nr:DUF4147 domain-containing protein [Telmatocola sphagniphila]QVL32795.1 DUF4147 domain-containing protein [Telmatocola sphagniphila]